MALLDPRDAHHAAASTHFSENLHRLITTEAVVVEASHFAARKRGDAARVLECLISVQVPIISLHLPMHEQCVHLLRRYADVPMDYADATLVALADRLRISRVFTLDRRGFRSYRGARGVPFELLPAP